MFFMLVSMPSRASQIFRPYFRPIPYPAPAAEPIALNVNEAIAVHRSTLESFFHPFNKFSDYDNFLDGIVL